MPVVGYCSPGILRIRHLDTLLEAPARFFFQRPGRDVTHIAGWGLKPTAKKARRIAAARDLPYISLEDGFLRSLELGVSGAPAHSMVVDHSGIYYDATHPSDLETLVRDADFSESEIERARECMVLLRRYRLSKYNRAPDMPLQWPDRPRVLVVDQTLGDAAVTFGGAGADSFRQMLEAAIAEHPESEVCVKVHPDVIAGKKRGYLLELAREHGCRVLAEDISPWAVLDVVDEVYVVTSQMGFDALLAGRKVHCFGLPFYAGWGLTEDRQHCERRGVPRSLEQVFCAAYLRYSRYINPYTGERCELEDTIALLAEQKRQRARLGDCWLGLGFSPWKRRFVPDFLGRPSTLEFAPARPAAVRARQGASQTRVAAWASGLAPSLVRACKDAGMPLWRMEDGFLRSVGLGADLVRPLSLVLDARGIYYDARAASDLEAILAETEFDRALLARACALRESLVSARLSKYNVGQAGKLTDLGAAPGQRVLLVPGQVETDASIAGGSPLLKTNEELLRAVRALNPDAFIVYKPHPDVVAGARRGAVTATELWDRQITDAAMPQLLEQVDEVHTLCSLSGFEALLRGRKVVTYGLPFYAGWGVSEDLLLDPVARDKLQSVADARAGQFDPAPVLARRGRTLEIDQLVAGVLLLYPVYCDPHTGELVNAETAVRLLQQQRERPAPSGPLAIGRRLFRLYRNAFLRR
ncbi:capsular polysaccharide biosynthesis protein [Microbulbifer zhoushanensis]|uniref:capsular polysaccharide biosynthesis protein n=1 Tax=Microbulbifer zhoushanensis TaxID=2904254 RepID=UPI001F1EF346|nr:capsular polysaccharide biosynthesis protein [Microbulbifer zhoushanensis]